MKLYSTFIVYCCCLIFSDGAYSEDIVSEDIVNESNIDFVHYKTEIAPNFNTRSIEGVVEITFTPNVRDLNHLNFSAKFKQIKSVYFDEQKLDFSIENEVLTIQLPFLLKTHEAYSVKVEYEASPTRGMKFYEDHLFTVYHTKNWLVSHDDLSDKATFDLSIKHDAGITSIGNGTLVSKQRVSDTQVVSRWQQNTPMPLYTFGLAMGEFDELLIDTSGVNISVLYRPQAKSGLTADLVKKAFRDVTDMLSFFESKAGFRLEQNYTYVVVDGYLAQEASGFSLVGEKFVHTLLSEKNENWFIAHELAHEWWGNSITSSNFSHYWLNEGLVVFLVAAYKQHSFGETAYKNEIIVAVKRVKHAVKENKISPVAFRKVIREQDINRTMAYSKGALVFYMLREKLGDKLFWESLKKYSLTYKGQSVTTKNLKITFEQVAGTDLTAFFDRWVYGEEVPVLDL